MKGVGQTCCIGWSFSFFFPSHKSPMATALSLIKNSSSVEAACGKNGPSFTNCHLPTQCVHSLIGCCLPVQSDWQTATFHFWPSSVFYDAIQSSGKNLEDGASAGNDFWFPALLFGTVENKQNLLTFSIRFLTCALARRSFARFRRPRSQSPTPIGLVRSFRRRQRAKETRPGMFDDY